LILSLLPGSLSHGPPVQASEILAKEHHTHGHGPARDVLPLGCRCIALQDLLGDATVTLFITGDPSIGLLDPLPAQTAMFNALEGLTDTCQRIAGFSLAGESVATYLTQKSLQDPSVPEWIKQPYRRITGDEEGHGSIPQQILKRYATAPERQDIARRAVAMRMVLFREYLASLDRWAMGKGPW